MKQLIKKIIEHFGYEIRKKNIFETIYQTDPLFNNRYEEAQLNTQMVSTDNLLRRQRHYVLNYLIANVDLSTGDVCEAGCWRGLSSYQIASYINNQNVQAEFHIFDSFAGLSDIQLEDRYERERRSTEALKKQFACSIEEVKSNLKQFNFIKYYKGWIPDKFYLVKNKTFSFVHIDVDLYQPIFDSFNFFYPHLTQGGIMVFDDYGCLQFPGAKKAVDECLLKFDSPFFLPLPSGQAFLIKNK